MDQDSGDQSFNHRSAMKAQWGVELVNSVIKYLTYFETLLGSLLVGFDLMYINCEGSKISNDTTLFRVMRRKTATEYEFSKDLSKLGFKIRHDEFPYKEIGFL